MREPDNPLLVAIEWGEAHTVVPDGAHRGADFKLGDEQLLFVGNHYDVSPDAFYNPAADRDLSLKQNPRGSAFVFRRSQLVRAQKWGKSPLIAFFICIEAVGPALFAGWAEGGEVYRCSNHGCWCGWEYFYSPGEPMGRPWPTPRIQVTATSEDQTDNTYDALRPMIELGPLSQLMPKLGEEFIRTPGGGLIEVVTSKATSRLGARVTFVPQDETGLWVSSNGGHNLAKKQRQGLAGMDGRAIETTNAWNPAEDSTAQRTFETKVADVYKDFRQPPKHLRFTDRKDRRKIFQFNYAGAPWANIASIESEAEEMMEKDPADAERFFGNRLVSGDGAWLDMAKYYLKGFDGDDGRPLPLTIRPRTKICLGFDGSDNEDHTGFAAETLDFYAFTPTYGDNRAALWNPKEWGGRIPRAEVRAAFAQIANEFEIVRAYFDPEFWETEIDEFAAEYGVKKILKWPTNRPAQMHAALERYRTDLYSTESGYRHDGDPIVAAHARNAVTRTRSIDKVTKRRIYILGKPTEHQKVDYIMSRVLAHEAACDAVAAGAREDNTASWVF